MPTPRRAFILRLWLEPGSESEAPVLRGSLQLAESQELHCFATIAQIPELLQRLTDWGMDIHPVESSSEDIKSTVQQS